MLCSSRTPLIFLLAPTRTSRAPFAFFLLPRNHAVILYPAIFLWCYTLETLAFLSSNFERNRAFLSPFASPRFLERDSICPFLSLCTVTLLLYLSPLPALSSRELLCRFLLLTTTALFYHGFTLFARCFDLLCARSCV